MIQYVLIGILFLGLIVLAVLLSKEKAKNSEREKAVMEEIHETVGKLKVQYETANSELSELLKKTKNNLEDNTKAHVNRIDKSIEVAVNTSKERLSRVVSEHENKMVDMQNEYNNRMQELSNDFNKTISDGIKETQDKSDSKFAMLAGALEQVIAKNAELKKKLEFFTEIDEDSKNLNETEDEEARNRLIQQALAELKVVPEKEEFEGTVPAKIETVIVKPPVTIDYAPREKLTTTEDTKQEQVNIPKQSTEETPSVSSVEPLTNMTAVRVPSILDKEQKLAFSIMNSTDDNLFITGKAGTGKSFLLDMFVEGTQKKTIKLAPTGIAALNIEGTTLHSTFGYNNLERINLDDINMKTIELNSDKIRILREVDTFIIDEISMVRADIFDKIDKMLRVLNKSAKPFGGKQMIVFGDLFQLPPVVKKQEQKYLTDYYGGIFFFNSNAYSKGQFGFIELLTNHRQKDDQAFFEILNRMREGRITNVDINNLNSRYVENRDELRRVLTFFPKKADAEIMNREELKKIEAKEYMYKARIIYNAKTNQNPNLDIAFPITEELRLKRGALVMLVANDLGKRWVNGTMGIVHSLTEKSIHVNIDGTIYEVEKTTFNEKEAVYKDGYIDYKDIFSVEQFPVVLAYAITIHKSQGMTYKKIACDISQCFAPGQAYVALSRCSSIGGLHLLKPIHSSMIKVEDKVIKFYRSQSTEKTFQKYSYIF